MSEIICSNCGKENPDFFDNCQFCQEPLRSESTLQPGENPAEMDTGELEPILPDWLQDARQQSRDSGDADSFSPETKPRIQTNEPLDLLAGLAAQDDSDEDEVPDWLASINPVKEGKSETTSSDQEEEPSDFFSQFSQAESQPDTPQMSDADQGDSGASLIGGLEPQSEPQTDELGSWFSQTSDESSETGTSDLGASETEDNSWMNNLGAPESSVSETPAEKESEDLSWLHDLEAVAKETGDLSSPQVDADSDFAPVQSESVGEDLDWLNDLGGAPIESNVEISSSQPESPQDDSDWLKNLGDESTASTVETSPSQPESSQDDLGWMANLGTDQPSTTDEPASVQSESSQDDLSWMANLGGSETDASDESAYSEAGSSQEDLSWMANLGSSETEASDDAVPLQSESSQDDLSWMANLGADQPSTSDEPLPSQLGSSQEDLSWMANLGGSETEASDEAVPLQSESSQDDLSWMANLGTDQPSTSDEPVPSQSGSSQEDLSWMANLGSSETEASDEAVPAQLESSQDDLSWMADLGAEQNDSAAEAEATQLTPPGTAPLDENAGHDSTPDWLKSAMEEPSMPAPGDLSMDWFTDNEEAVKAEEVPVTQEISDFQMDDASAPTQDEPASVFSNLDLPLDDNSETSSQDIDALFNIDMPDIESQEDSIQSETGDTLAVGDETLAPVELPSWVQAMRPVDSAIDETSYTDDEEQEPESEGPLAGFSGVIPSAPIGSSLRPKAFSLKLQVSEEQQAGASLIEQIIASEAAVHPSKPTTGVASQRILRRALSGLFLVVLSLVLGFGWQKFDILAPEKVSELSRLVATIPDEAPVLLIVDYEPAVAGEMVAATGPVLDQLAQSRQSEFTFISMSPNGSAMVEHLMLNTKVSSLGYAAGEQYLNKGFLPGGSAGVLGFINDSAFSNFEAVVLLTDNAESGRVWIEQLQVAKQARPEIAFKPLIVVSSAQAGPMLEPYVSSGQVNVMINGLSDAAKYEYVNQSRPGIARTYWDSFGVGLLLAVLSIVVGGVWNLLTGIRERRAEAEQG